MKKITVQQAGRMGGKQSVKSRFDGLSKSEISTIMSQLRKRKEKNTIDKMGKAALNALRTSGKS